MKMTGTLNQPNKSAATTATTSKLIWGSIPAKVFSFGLLLIMGRSLNISQLIAATTAYRNHLLVSRFNTHPVFDVQ